MTTRNTSPFNGSPENALTHAAGYFFPNGVDPVDNSLNISDGFKFTATRTPDGKAHVDLTINANLTTNEGTVFTVGSTTLTAETGTPGALQYKIGATPAATLTNLIAAYVLAADPDVDVALYSATKVRFTAKVAGTEGNSIASSVGTNTDGVATMGAAHLAGGTDGDGIFTIKLPCTFNTLLHPELTVYHTDAADLDLQLAADNIASDGSIVVHLHAAGTLIDMAAASGNKIGFDLHLNASRQHV